MKYSVCHKFGVSLDYNTFAHHPWHGTGQGVANTVLCYIALSDTLIDACHSHTQPSILHDPTLTLTITTSIKAFINDVAMSAQLDTTNLTDLVTAVQAQLQWWNQGVRETVFSSFSYRFPGRGSAAACLPVAGWIWKKGTYIHVVPGTGTIGHVLCIRPFVGSSRTLLRVLFIYGMLRIA